MELLNRKQNRLWEYDYSQNGAYFVTICTQGRKKILSDIVGDGSPVLPVHKNHIMNRKRDHILSRKTAKKDAVSMCYKEESCQPDLFAFSPGNGRK